VNPKHLENQVEGAVVMAIGGALFEAIEFNNGAILNARFSRYRVPRFSDVPGISSAVGSKGPSFSRRRRDSNRGPGPSRGKCYLRSNEDSTSFIAFGTERSDFVGAPLRGRPVFPSGRFSTDLDHLWRAATECRPYSILVKSSRICSIVLFCAIERLSMIRVQNLTKRFGDVVAVDDISFDVHRGEIFAFLGPNGAGKTTTIKMLTTLLKPTQGSLELDGLDPTVQRDEVRKRFGVVFRIPVLIKI
jgi:ABC-type glutathione transport system ATPase component